MEPPASKRYVTNEIWYCTRRVGRERKRQDPRIFLSLQDHPRRRRRRHSGDLGKRTHPSTFRLDCCWRRVKTVRDSRRRGGERIVIHDSEELKLDCTLHIQNLRTEPFTPYSYIFCDNKKIRILPNSLWKGGAHGSLKEGGSLRCPSSSSPSSSSSTFPHKPSPREAERMIRERSGGLVFRPFLLMENGRISEGKGEEFWKYCSLSLERAGGVLVQKMDLIQKGRFNIPYTIRTGMKKACTQMTIAETCYGVWGESWKNHLHLRY